MARFTIPLYQVNRSQFLTISAAASASFSTPNGGQVVNNGATLLFVSSSSGSPQVFNVELPVGLDGQAITPQSYTIPANSYGIVGPFPQVDYSGYLIVDAPVQNLKFFALSIV